MAHCIEPLVAARSSRLSIMLQQDRLIMFALRSPYPLLPIRVQLRFFDQPESCIKRADVFESDCEEPVNNWPLIKC